jgi:hypothetical protein
MDDCTLPFHHRAAKIAVEAEIVATELRGLSWLVSGWTEYLHHSFVSSDIHGQVGLFVTESLQTLAHRLDPDRDDVATGPAGGNGAGRLTLLKPEGSA